MLVGVEDRETIRRVKSESFARVEETTLIVCKVDSCRPLEQVARLSRILKRRVVAVRNVSVAHLSFLEVEIVSHHQRGFRTFSPPSQSSSPTSLMEKQKKEERGDTNS